MGEEGVRGATKWLTAVNEVVGCNRGFSGVLFKSETTTTGTTGARVSTGGGSGGEGGATLLAASDLVAKAGGKGEFSAWLLPLRL